MSNVASGALDGGIEALGAAYASGAATPLDVLEVAQARIAAANGALNIVVHQDRARAEQAAEAATQRWRAGKALSPLDGVPVGVKANIAIGGLPWTAAIAAYKDRIATTDAFAVAKLRSAGAVIVGALNMHEAALGGVTDSPLYGKAMNPLRASHTPGGSSGGSAAAVAAGFAAGALGTDTLGSVRIPSAYCGVSGFKPTYGRISQGGVAPLSWTLDHVGVHARHARDLEHLFDAVHGYDPGDPFSVHAPADSLQWPLQGMRIGRVRFAEKSFFEPEVLMRFEEACNQLAQAGALLVDIALDGYDFAHMRRTGLIVSEAEGSAAMRSELAADPDGFSPGLRKMLAYGAGVPGARLAEAYRAIADVRLVARACFAQCDVMVLPTAPQAAFSHDQAAPVSQADLTAFANFAGLPAASVPMGAGRDGLPTGLQIVGKAFDDAQVLAVATAFEELQA